MSENDLRTFPLVGLEAVANAQQEWVAVAFRLHPDADVQADLLTLFSYPDMAAALAPLDCIVPLADPLRFADAHMPVLPASRVVLRVRASALIAPAARKRCAALAEQGYRILVDGEAGLHASQAGVVGVAADCRVGLPSTLALVSLPGPHWARKIADGTRLAACRAAGLQWFSGPYAYERQAPLDDATSRKRLLELLGLLARDADTREVETQLKQDPALSYHLLRMVNSAAFGRAEPIHNFGQAINLLGRRQLQRWLQLLLYARPQLDGAANPLLPLAALRAAQMEALVKLQGGDRDRQDMAFVVGVFALLDILLGMPMADIVAALNLDPEIDAALLQRSGPLGELLMLVEQPLVQPVQLAALGLAAEGFWQGQLQAWHWAIQVSRNL